MRLSGRNMLKWGLFLVGLGVVVWLVRSVGLHDVAREFEQLGWAVFVLLIPYSMVYLFDAAGWYATFGVKQRIIGFWRIFFIRAAGESLNNSLPAAYLGGEPVKVLLLTRLGVDAVAAATTVIVAKTTMTIAQIVFIVLGCGAFYLAAEHAQVVPGLVSGIFASLVIGIIVVVLLVVWQKTGFSRPIRGLAGWLGVLGRLVTKHQDGLERLDQNLSQFHSMNERRFWVSTGLFLAGWMVGTLEVYLFAKILGLPLSLTGALAIEALSTMAKAMAFFIPASIGAQEGAIVLLFLSFGYPALEGVVFALIRRFRELIWVVFGLMLLGWYGLRHSGES